VNAQPRGQLEGPPRIEAGRARVREGCILCLFGSLVRLEPFGPEEGELVRHGACWVWSCRKFRHKFVAS
jgi:hypothetical protein